MDQQSQQTHEVFMETAAVKLKQQDQQIQEQDKRLTALEGKFSDMPDQSDDLRQIKARVQTIDSKMDKLQFPTQKMEEFSRELKTGVATIKQPVTTEIKHHHYVPGLIWIAGGLFLVLCLVSSGWFMTTEKMGQYRANDIKYRNLKLAPDSAVAAYLFWLDSIYLAQPDSFTNAVLEKERLKEERLDIQGRLNSVNRRINELNGKGK